MNNDVAEWDHVNFNPEDWAEGIYTVSENPTGNLFIFTSTINLDDGIIV